MKIFYDMDTQNDLMNSEVAVYVPDAKLITSNLRKLTNYTKENFIPVVGSVYLHFGTPEYKHRESELQVNGGALPNHCMEGKSGQMKVSYTILKRNDMRPSGDCDHSYHVPHWQYHNYPKEPIPEEFHNYFAEFESEKWIKNHWEKLLPGVVEGWINDTLELIKEVQKKKQEPNGIYFEKQSHDIFTNPNFPYFLEQANITEAIVYGVATDTSIKPAVLGMQQKGIQCYVVTDAIKGYNIEKTKTALEEMTNAGAKFVTTNEVTGVKK